MKIIGMIMLVMLGFAVSASARTVYLENGEEIDAQRVWKKRDTIYVLVNRDILLTFAVQEVDVKKSGLRSATKKPKRMKHCPRRKASAAPRHEGKPQAPPPSTPRPH